MFCLLTKKLHIASEFISPLANNNNKFIIGNEKNVYRMRIMIMDKYLLDNTSDSGRAIV